MRMKTKTWTKGWGVLNVMLHFPVENGVSLKVFERRDGIRSYLSRRVEIRLPQQERLKVRRPARMWLQSLGWAMIRVCFRGRGSRGNDEKPHSRERAWASPDE